MPYEFEIKNLQSHPTATVREKTPDVGMVFGKLLGEVFAQLGAEGVAPVSPPYARFFSVGADGLDMEVGIGVEKPIAGNGRVVPGELPAGRAVVTWHTGPYDQLRAANEAVQAWIAEQHLTVAGPAWEVYHSDPSKVTDPAQLRTEIIYPVR
jgi:effector-binding domain-containing protein